MGGFPEFKHSRPRNQPPPVGRPSFRITDLVFWKSPFPKKCALSGHAGFWRALKVIASLVRRVLSDPLRWKARWHECCHDDDEGGKDQAGQEGHEEGVRLPARKGCGIAAFVAQSFQWLT